MVKKSVNSTKRQQFSGTKALNSLVEVGIKVTAFVTVTWWRQATWNQRDGVNTTGAWMWLSTRNPADELRQPVEVWGVYVLCTLAAHSARCSCLRSSGFPVDGITYKQMQICSVLKFNISRYQSDWKKSSLCPKFCNRTDCTVFMNWVWLNFCPGWASRFPQKYSLVLCGADESCFRPTLSSPEFIFQKFCRWCISAQYSAVFFLSLLTVAYYILKTVKKDHETTLRGKYQVISLSIWGTVVII